MPESARTILAEFGGLELGLNGPGIEIGRGRMKFDPLLVAGESDRYQLLRAVYPLGELDGGHGHMVVLSDGSIWGWSLDHRLRLLGPDIETALDRHLRGRKALQTIDAVPPDRSAS